MKPTGLITIIAALLLPFLWWPEIAQGRDGIALFSQYLGLGALIAMAFGQVIATRWPGVELVFGPMDQTYRLHKWLGIGAMVAILLHDTVDAEMKGLGRETALVEFAETLGEISLYGLLIFVVITIATFIPYHLWKWTHRFIGIFFVMGAIHYLFILKPFKNGDPLGLYMGGVCIVGLLAYLWTSAPRRLRPSNGYEIRNVTQAGDAISVDMTATGRPLRHRAGQFSFFRFSGANLNEPHPFTISAAPNSAGDLRVTVAPLGDLTTRVTRVLAAGQTVQVTGPYGHFGRTKGAQVWVAAGVGVTPFAALAQALSPDAPAVTMIYCVRSPAEAAHLQELQTLAATKPNFDLILWESRPQGRLTAKALAGAVGDLSARKVLFCGPIEMRKALARDLPALGVSRRRFQYENFEIRTGLGLRRMAGWLLAQHEKRTQKP